ncbi:sigma-70 family RNA polymerase sigma factor [Tsukamurella sp. 8F]|uniref:sigma-70 family RNA polymerase sigma factor n=1 Tax=unclassified Tsukamurella TaxID=2633480 RepID=UPI0023B9084B|nr:MULTISPECIES: sigma-70 family RNA polymerase sigma factor [unclassified Tsukamurella]MDF0531953.1 sigma-70 family RNA polymerase sigma factor [Tsukamurella sp. 8J]MDF0587996.1 sigma-70 family RNA polymerase sigma factor [Tsukamurella sp. 8F]
MNLAGEELDRAVLAATRGDRKALADVLESIRPPVVRYCRARVGAFDRHSMSADDIAQEVCMAVMTALPRYEDQGRPFMAFVYGIAAHKVADGFRSAGRNKADPVDDIPETVSTEGGPEALALDSDAGRRMQLLLQILPEKQREIVILRVVVGLSAEETADVVGGTAGAVRVAQHRALSRLKNELMREGESSGRGA